MNYAEQYNALQEVRLSRVQNHPELKHNKTLANFLWSTQGDRIRTLVVNWLQKWALFAFKEGEPSPAPILHLHGPNNLGKSHLALAIARFFALNYPSLNTNGYICSAQVIRWIEYCKSQLNGENITINDTTNILVIDDIDSFRPIPKSMSTWVIEEAIATMKIRAERAVLPTIITGNWSPRNLHSFFSNNAIGQNTPSTEQAAKTLCSVIERNTYASLHFTGKDIKDKSRDLPLQALKENDMTDFKFLEKYGLKVQF